MHWITVESRKGTGLKSPDRVQVCKAASRSASRKGESLVPARAGMVKAAACLLPYHAWPHGGVLTTNYVAAHFLLPLTWLLPHSSLMALLTTCNMAFFPTTLALNPKPRDTSLYTRPHGRLEGALLYPFKQHGQIPHGYPPFI